MTQTLKYYSDDRYLLDQEIALSLNYPDNAFSCLSSDLAEQFLIKASQEIENSFLSDDLLDKEKYSSAIRSLQLSILENLKETKISCPKCDRTMKGKEESNLICLGCELYFEKDQGKWSLYPSKISTEKNWNDAWNGNSGDEIEAAIVAVCAFTAARGAGGLAPPLTLEAHTLNACLKLYKMKAFI